MIDRRTFLAGASAATIITPSFSQIAPSQAITSVNGANVPAIGMGTWLTFDVGGDDAALDQRAEVLRTFFEMGGALIDSSPMYGSSQSVLGAALGQLNRPVIFAADKVWIDGAKNGPQQVANSAKNWGVDNFDLLQVHNLRSWRGHLETLFSMKADGLLRYVGITSYSGLRYDEIEKIMRDHPIDFIQITYNIIDREAENRLLPLAREKGIATIANRPFQQGALIDAANRRPLPAMAAEIGAANWAQFLLKFIISHPALTFTIPATRRVDHMRENMGALAGATPDEAFRRRMVGEIDDI